MKGIIFNTVERIVIEAHGEDAWDDLLEMAGVDGNYHSMGNYDDKDILALVGAAAKMLDKPPGDVTLWLGEKAMAIFHESWPELFKPYAGCIEFITQLNEIIHPEVHKLYPGADTPVFTYLQVTPSSLTMQYDSARKLCMFAEGLILGTAAVYKQKLTVKQTACVHRNDDACIFKIDVV
jgi:hypothetical protein